MFPNIPEHLNAAWSRFDWPMTVLNRDISVYRLRDQQLPLSKLLVS